MDREAWQATVHGAARVRHDFATKHNHNLKNEENLDADSAE